MASMKTKVVRIGNSRGIRIPKVILEQYRIKDTVELETKDDGIMIRSTHPVRKGWDAAFKAMHKNKDDALLIADGLGTAWDEKEWTW